MRCFSAVCCLLMSLAWLSMAGAAPQSGADADWEAIVSLDRGPGTDYHSRADAQKRALEILGVQEKALHEFITSYPSDGRVIDAKLRLAHLLATRGDLEGKPELQKEAQKIVDELGKSPETPKERMPDIAFADISLAMRRMPPEPDDRERDLLLDRIREFEMRFPEDRRVGRLLAEVATLYDGLPKRKQELLREALRYAKDEELKMRINDDLRRLELLGKPLNLRFTSVQGQAVDLKNYRGSVVVIYFFASSSPPAMLGLVGLKDILSGFKPGQVRPIGISVDTRKEGVMDAIKTAKIDWPVYFDGKGWESPMVRSMGINEVPTVWVVDREGNLRTLNAVDNTENGIRQLLNAD